MFTDGLRDKAWNELRQRDLRTFAPLLTPRIFQLAAEQAGVRVGRNALNVVNMAWLGIACAMRPAGSFAFVLTTTLKLLEDCREFHSTPLGKLKRQGQRAQRRRQRAGKNRSKHSPYRDDPTIVTEEAFVRARQRMPLSFWVALLTLLAERFQGEHARYQAGDHGFRLVAMDGSTLPLPKNQDLAAHYGRPKNGAGKKANAQARIVMMTLPGTRIPIAYELAPLADSELTLAGRLMRHVRRDDLLLIDRGFVSYGLFWEIQNRDAAFGTRLKKRLNLTDVRRLGRHDRLVRWTPKDTRGQWKLLPPSMELRVIDYQLPGFRASAILTNVLDPKRLSREDWLRMAADCDDKGKWAPGLYHRRWQIETSYCELKVVLQLKNLRSHTRASVEYEVAGRIVYYLLLRWLIVLAAEKHGLDPLQISFRNAVRELEQMQAMLVTQSEEWVRLTLLPRLLDRIASHTVPSRPGRHYPRPNDTKPKTNGSEHAKINDMINTRPKNGKSKARKG